ncbi:MAG: lipid-A-disaccharide synthase [Bacteroidales bacterium]|nr:lipid-A-disaccharide synthase [Bacteroidales bacterium]
MKYYLIAGEASGDLHGSLLMRALAARDPQAQFRFRGGEKMAAVGGEMAHDYRDTAVMGIVEVLAKAGEVRRNLAACKADIERWRPDVVILIDYPGFNLKIARFAHGRGFKVFYYIAPKVWASREGRLKQLRQYVDRLFVIFPFEVDWFCSRGLEPVYEGNPLVDYIDEVLAAAPSREAFLLGNGLDSRPVIALLPGSRMQEIKFLAPRFKALASDARFAGCQFVIAGAPGVDAAVYQQFFGNGDGTSVAGSNCEADNPNGAGCSGEGCNASGAIRPGLSIPVIYGQTYQLLKHSAAAAVASGTASFEAAVIGTPQVVCYGMNPLTWRIAISILKVPYVSLANLIMGRLIFKELLQDACTPAAVADELLRLASDADYRDGMLQQYASLRQRIGASGSATRIADAIKSSI